MADIFSGKEAEAAKKFSETLEEQNMACAVKELQKYFDDVDSIQLNIAITGECGDGKSSFVNALRGLGDEDELSAKTDYVETTMDPTPYSHPKLQKVTFWDLPGIGTPSFKAEEYLRKVKFSQYDFFIIITSSRFRQSGVDLAKNIQAMGKKFYFVRSKIDNDINAEQQKKKVKELEPKQKFDLLGKIQQNCINGLQQAGFESPKVFLISRFELGRYDFNLLQKTIEMELPKHKRDKFLLALPNVTMEIHQKKKEALQARTWMLALLSASVAALPIPGLSITADLSILKNEIEKYFQTFDLNDEALQNLSHQTGVPFKEFKDCLQSPLSKEFSADMLKKMLYSLGAGTEMGAVMMVVQEVLRLIPFTGFAAAVGISAGISFVITKKMLDKCLEDLADDAQRVLKRALQTDV